MLITEVSAVRVLGIPRLDWMDGVNVSLCSSWMTVVAARQCANGRKEWRALVHMQLVEFHSTDFLGFLCSFEPPSRTQVSYQLETGGMP